ncbi:type II toxin-antitoxin system PemK/MazF family toxin [Helicobacter cetorum]|uniref:type II toxin-antitoxin system PemK/MazF family toxin n=1 Tax=Helicobacter cetorum TaxID=138563 RepID=UPI00117F7C3E|nr:type II toxin-antitoxin system PemK/MazF family toxin [Helicobacter cetorum]
MQNLYNNKTEQVALLHQIRTFDTRRSQGKIANVQNETLEIIKDKIKSEIL